MNFAPGALTTPLHIATHVSCTSCYDWWCHRVSRKTQELTHIIDEPS